MKMSKEAMNQGYESVDARPECDRQYREKHRREMEIMGYHYDSPMEYGEGETGVPGGFIKRNNTRDRL